MLAYLLLKRRGRAARTLPLIPDGRSVAPVKMNANESDGDIFFLLNSAGPTAHQSPGIRFIP